MKVKTFRHEFVDSFPEAIEDGVIYVSIPFAIAKHNCACGCGNPVVTPFSPTDWNLTFDGDTISISPSIGNWGFPCKSHYWIRRGRVKEARRWSSEEVNEGRERDSKKKKKYFDVRLGGGEWTESDEE